MNFYGVFELVLNIVSGLYILMIIFGGVYDLCYSHAQRRKAK